MSLKHEDPGIVAIFSTFHLKELGLLDDKELEIKGLLDKLGSLYIPKHGQPDFVPLFFGNMYRVLDLIEQYDGPFKETFYKMQDELMEIYNKLPGYISEPAKAVLQEQT